MKNKLFLISILVILMGCLTGHSYSSTGLKSTFKETSKFSTDLIIKKNSKDIELSIIVELETGECNINITNPENEIVDTITINTIGKTNINKIYKSKEGQWKLSFESSKAVGSFDLKWSNE